MYGIVQILYWKLFDIYLLSEYIFGFLLFKSQHVHIHPVVTIASTNISRPTMIPSVILATSQLFIFVSLVQVLKLSCCVVVSGLVYVLNLNVAVVDGSVSFMVEFWEDI